MKSNKNQIISVAIVMVAAITLSLLRKYSYTLRSNKLPIKRDSCYMEFPSTYHMEYKRGNQILSTYCEEEEPCETYTYNYIYNSKTKEIKYYENKKYKSTKKILYYDDKIFILQAMTKDGDEIQIGSYDGTNSNILDEYKEIVNYDVSGYYQYTNDIELYLSKDNKIYFGSKDGIKKGTYETYKFKTEYLSRPLINYTLEGKKKLGNTHRYRYYNDTSIYIQNVEEKALIRCTKYNENCSMEEREIVMEKITDTSNLKYLKNIS
jgi:hypothetical protein